MPGLQDVGLYQVSGPLLIGSFFAGIACVALRFRRSREIERQQLKWFAAAVMTVLAVIVVVFAVYQATGRNHSDAIFLIGTSIIPVATGLAMLRYRLYEIDVIMRRTVVYSALIVALAALYLGGVALLGWIFRSVTGQSGALAVTVSTLLVAAAFQPLRHRIQRTVDHRFYRRKYDAAVTLDAFSGRLREQIDLDALQTEVLGVVTETLQPSHASLWLRTVEPPPATP